MEKNKDLELLLKAKALNLIMAILELENVLDKFDLSNAPRPWQFEPYNLDLNSIKSKCIDIVKP